MSAHIKGCGEDVAAYALGALPEPDARAFRAHLEDCELCRTDLATLKPVVDRLPNTVEAVEPPPQLKKRIMSVVEAEAKQRHRAERAERDDRETWFDRVFVRRNALSFAAAAVLLLAGIGVGLSASRDDVETRTYTGNVVGGGTAQLEMEDSRGRLVVAGLPAPPEGRVYQVWIKADDEAPKPTDALFTPSRDGRASVAVPGDMTGVDEVLVTHEPAGGSRVPTVKPAIDIRT